MRRILAIALLLLSGIGFGHAQTYPSKPIVVVLPFAAGGPTDTLTRILAERMRASLGQPVIVENSPGAAGTLSIARVVRSNPDGYTLSLGPWNSHVVTGAVYPLQFDLLKDLEPVALIASNPSVVVSKNAVPAKTFQELIAWVKANQDKVVAGTAGVGAGTHVAGLLFQNMTGTRLQFVPYRGAAPAMQDLVAGQIDLMFDQLSNSIQQIRSGTIRPYAIMASTRAAAAPDIPTVDEAGLPGFYLPIWHGLWAPKNTPREIIEKIDKAVVESLADATVRQRLADIGQEIPPVAQQTPAALGAFHKAEIEKWWPIVKAANIKPE